MAGRRLRRVPNGDGLHPRRRHARQSALAPRQDPPGPHQRDGEAIRVGLRQGPRARFIGTHCAARTLMAPQSSSAQRLQRPPANVTLRTRSGAPPKRPPAAHHPPADDTYNDQPIFPRHLRRVRQAGRLGRALRSVPAPRSLAVGPVRPLPELVRNVSVQLCRLPPPRILQEGQPGGVHAHRQAHARIGTHASAADPRIEEFRNGR